MADCPCGSRRVEGDCCQRYHHGLEAPTVEALVRARYVACVRRDYDYLWATLHDDAPGRIDGPDAWRAAESTIERLDHRRLLILSADDGPDADGLGRALFHVTAYEGRKNRSFAEHARFAGGPGAWRYLDGLRQRDAALPVPPEQLTYDVFELAARR